jgi:flagellar protein FliO/FliZ
VPKPEPAPETPARVSDPFSVEEIEAEFARLLGRPVEKNGKV